jgi:type I restriction enzyme S subunit
MRAMKDSGVEWIGEIPEEWNLIQTKRRFFNRKRVVGDAVNEYERLALTMRGVIKRSKEDSEGLQPEKFEGYQILEKNSLVFKLIDLENVNTSRVGLSPYTGLVSPAYIVLSNKLEDNRFYYYWFMFMYYNEVFNHLGGDGVRSALNAKDVLSIPIPDISADNQKRIANYLDIKCSKIDSIIDKQQEVIEKLKDYKQSFITDIITRGIKPHVKMKDSGIKWVDKIPVDWENRKVLSILSMRVVDGPHESPELYNDGIPYISASAIENGKINFDKKRGYISEEYCDICDQRYKPQRNDILVIKLGGSTGQVAIVDTDERFNIWVPLAAVRCNEMANPYFVYYAFQSHYFIRQMELSWTFGTQQTLGVKTIEGLRIMLPPIDEQNEIVDFLKSKCDKLDEYIAEKQHLVDLMTSYKKSLIYEVVTGKKEV